MEKELINIILSEKYNTNPDCYSCELYFSVTQEELNVLMDICKREKHCIQIIHDFSEDE